MDKIPNGRFVLNEFTELFAVGFGVLGQIPGCGALWIEVPDKGGDAFLASQIGCVHGGGRFTDATLKVMKRDDLHGWDWLAFDVEPG